MDAALRVAGPLIRIRLSDTDLVSLRLSYGPYWDILCAALRVSGSGPRSGAPRQRALLGAAGSVAAIPGVQALQPRVVPAFLTIPTEPGEGLEASLDRLMAVKPTETESDIADYASAFPDRREAILAAWSSPLETLASLRAELLAAWQRGFGAAWPAIEAVHQGDLMYRSLALTRSGPAELLEDLRPAAWLDGNDLCVPATYAARYAPGGAGLVLITSVFAPDELLTGTIRWGRWVVVHPPVGRAMLWLHDPLAAPLAQLSQLIGPVRAQILTALEIPRTTGDIADLCRLAPNTTSYHLSRLRDAGMVASSRAGRRSYYRLAARGARFLSLWRERSAA